MLRITFPCLLISALLAFAPGCGDDEEKTPVCSSDDANSHNIGMACTKGGGECGAVSLLCDADMIPEGSVSIHGICAPNCAQRLLTVAKVQHAKHHRLAVLRYAG